MGASEDDDDGAAVLFKKRGPKKATMRKRAATPPSDNGSDSEYSTDDGGGRRVKRRRRAGAGVMVVDNTTQGRSEAPAADFATSKYAAERNATIAPSDDATKRSDWYEEKELDAKQLLGTTRAAAAPKPTVRYDATAVTKHKNADDAAAAEKKGPVKPAANIRTITITDYSPDVCKDYKQTGFCGFGDNCKFLHAREDYAQGWQLEREWENVNKGKKHLGGTVVASRNGMPQDGDDKIDEAEAKLLEGLPFACIICKQPYKNPIVTRCNHYFCEACALRRFRKTPACAQCGAGTGGVFNGAKNLQRLLDKKREREKRQKELARENGEDVSDDDDADDAAADAYIAEEVNGGK